MDELSFVDVYVTLFSFASPKFAAISLLVLIFLALRFVEHSGFTSLNNQRFGARYVGDVANPSDLLLFHRKKDMKASAGPTKKRGAGLKVPIVPQELEKTNMEDLVLEYLEGQDKKLHILDKKKLSTALDEYVEKNMIASISETTSTMLKAAQKKVINREVKDGTVLKSGMIREIVETEAEAREEKSKSQRKQKASGDGQQDGDEEMEDAADTGKENDPEDDQLQASTSKTSSTSRRAGSSSSRSESNGSNPKRKTSSQRQPLDDDRIDDDDDDEGFTHSTQRSQATAKSKASASSNRPKRSSAKRPVSYKLDDGDDDDDSDAFVVKDSDDDDDDDEILEVDVPPSKKQKKRAQPKKAAGGGRPATSTSRSAKRGGRSTSRLDSDDDENDDDAAGYGYAEEDWGSAVTRSQL